MAIILKFKEVGQVKKNEGKAFLIINILVPLFVGATIYYFLSPDVIFVKRMDVFFRDSHSLQQH